MKPRHGWKTYRRSSFVDTLPRALHLESDDDEICDEHGITVLLSYGEPEIAAEAVYRYNSYPDCIHALELVMTWMRAHAHEYSSFSPEYEAVRAVLASHAANSSHHTSKEPT
jgi:hypothetical protein